MANLEEALRKFCSGFGRSGEDTGEVKFVEYSNAAYPASLPSCPALATLYQHSILNQAGIGGSLMLDLYDIDQLEKAQIGWRWKRNKDGTIETNPEWDPNLVLIGDRNGDALAVDTSETDGPVYGFIQGESILLANSLKDFFDIYSDWMQCEHSDFNMDVKVNNFNLEPQYLDRLTKIAKAKQSGSEVRGLIEYFFG